jgi:hypothetical protein
MSPIDAFLYACLYGYVFFGFGYYAKQLKARLNELNVKYN